MAKEDIVEAIQGMALLCGILAFLGYILYVLYWAATDPVDLFVEMSSHEITEPVALWYARSKEADMDELRNCIESDACQLTSRELDKLREWDAFLHKAIKGIRKRKGE